MLGCSPRQARVVAALLVCAIAHPALATNVFTSYANDFIDPNLLPSQYGSNMKGAQDTVIAWAEEMSSHGPWSVTFKPVVAPSGDKHDYMSWAPYQWPDCSNVGNKTALSKYLMRKQCNYVFRDGQVNPDRTIPNDFQSFYNLSDAVLHNALAWSFQNQSSSTYSQNAVKYIKTWFLDSDTRMNPNLNYAQMNLGPAGQKGEYTGILDLRMLAKVVSGVLLLRKRGSTDWTGDLDAQFVAWCKDYIGWLQSAPTAKQAAASNNNHGTHYVGQLMALMVMVGDNKGATTFGRKYFGTTFKGQIAAGGDQPMEASRSRPFHYRNFNIAGMITAARLLKYADPTSNVWNTTAGSAHGYATIRTTVDFMLSPSSSAARTKESDVAFEVYPNVAAVAAVYGDPQGTYKRFLDQSGFSYTQDAFWVWDQPREAGTRSENAKMAPNSIAGSGSAAAQTTTVVGSGTGVGATAATMVGAIAAIVARWLLMDWT
ncbi:Chondroitin AC/alginate lyase [Mycena kentingensis (nom. inval.)]|nr:Chondroitin AC/alginate lyase [Mycena kentingensis (nom. inval.)]